MAKQKLNTVRVNNKEWNKIKRRMTSGGDSIVAKVGFFPESRYGPENDNLPVATVAMWQEEGTRGGQNNGSGIPARPFMRYTIESLRKGDKDYSNILRREFVRFLDGKITKSKMISELGDYTKDQMKDNIVRWSTPPNSQSTIDRKGFNDPLVESGKMWQSVDSKLGRRTIKK